MRAQCPRVIKNKGGGYFCSSGASEGEVEAIGANLNRPPGLVCGSISFWQKRWQSRGGGRRGGHVRGQGEDDTPEGWTFLTLIVLRGQSFTFGRK